MRTSHDPNRPLAFRNVITLHSATGNGAKIGSGGVLGGFIRLRPADGFGFGSGGLSLRCHRVRQSCEPDAHFHSTSLCETGAVVD